MHVCCLFLTVLGIERGYTLRIKKKTTSSTTNCTLSSTVHFHIRDPISILFLCSLHHHCALSLSSSPVRPGVLHLLCPIF